MPEMTGMHHHVQLFLLQQDIIDFFFFTPRLAWNSDSPNVSLLSSRDDGFTLLLPVIIEMGSCELFALAGLEPQVSQS
jgi:hypothetical protein